MKNGRCPLFIFSLGILVLMMVILFNFLFLSHKIKEEMEMKVYLEGDANLEEIYARLDIMPQVKKFIFISKEKAWENVERKIEDSLKAGSFSLLSNPLPSMFRIFFKGEYVNKENLVHLQQDLEKLNGVEEVVYPEKVYQYLLRLLNLARFMVAGFIIVIIAYITLVMQSISGDKHLAKQASQGDTP